VVIDDQDADRGHGSGFSGVQNIKP
jgi:hypothetical protein